MGSKKNVDPKQKSTPSSEWWGPAPCGFSFLWADVTFTMFLRAVIYYFWDRIRLIYHRLRKNENAISDILASLAWDEFYICSFLFKRFTEYVVTLKGESK